MSIRSQGISFADLSRNLGVVSDQAVNAAAGYLANFVVEILPRDSPHLEVAVEGRFDPDPGNVIDPDVDPTGEEQPENFYKTHVVISRATFDRAVEAINTMLRAWRERTGSSAALTLTSALSIEGFTVAEVDAAVTELLHGWSRITGQPSPLPKKGGSGLVIAAALIGAGLLWWKLRG